MATEDPAPAPEDSTSIQGVPQETSGGTPGVPTSTGAVGTEGDDDDEVRTLFVSGLPVDVRLREVHLLFRPFPSYEGAILRTMAGKQAPVAFASFLDQASSLVARDALQGVCFDPESPVTLRIELAKANTKTKRARAVESPQTSTGAVVSPTAHTTSDMPEKRLRGFDTYPESRSGATGPSTPTPPSYHQPAYASSVPVSVTASGPAVYPWSQSYLTPLPTATPYLTESSFYSISADPTPSSSSRVAPCSTLFVANLGATTTEQELSELFTRCYGFRKLKMGGKGGAPVCFAEFQDVHCSTQAMNQLNGYMLATSDRGGIRVEYAKSRMGEPGRVGETQHTPFGMGGSYPSSTSYTASSSYPPHM